MAVAVVAACTACAASGGSTRPFSAGPGDDGAAVSATSNAPSFVASLQLETFASETELQGKVTELIPPAASAAGPDAWFHITLEGPKPGKFLALLPPQIPLPFQKGETVHGRFQCGGPPPGWACTGTIRAQDDTLLFFATRLGADPPPGWTDSNGPEFAGASTRTETAFYTTVGHRGKLVIVAPDAWRRLDSEDGRWLISGHTTSQPEGVTPVADWRPTRALSIVRLR